jgi:Ribbon-helix-helix protein, copG family
MSEREPTLRFALSHELMEQLYQLARRRNTSVSSLMRTLVIEALQENGDGCRPDNHVS